MATSPSGLLLHGFDLQITLCTAQDTPRGIFPATYRVSTTQPKNHLVVVLQSVKSHAVADFLLGGVAIGRVGWIRWVGWDDQLISGMR